MGETCPKRGETAAISVRWSGAARLCGSVAARHASFAVATQRRLGSRGAKALPCRSVDGEGQRCARHGPQRAPQRATGRRGRTGRDAHPRAWPSTRYAGRTGRARRVRRRGESTATRRASRRAVHAKTCGVSFSVTGILFRTFYVTDVTVARNGSTCGFTHCMCVRDVRQHA